MFKVIMKKERIDLLRGISVVKSQNGFSQYQGGYNRNIEDNQYNLEIGTTIKRYGYGFRTDMTQKEVGEALIELGLTILKDI